MPTTAQRQTAKAWLTEQFEYEYCAECGGDAQHHAVTRVLGNWFAVCVYSPSAETNWEWHPVIKAFHAGSEVSR